MEYKIYNSITGEIVQTYSGDLVNLEINIPSDCLWIESDVNAMTHYVVDGDVVPYPPRPNYPCNFNFITHEWVWDEQASWDIVRQERNRRLAASDWTQVPDAPVDQSAWAAYRQALRDLPANTTDPRNPNWPVKPILTTPKA